MWYIKYVNNSNIKYPYASSPDAENNPAVQYLCMNVKAVRVVSASGEALFHPVLTCKRPNDP